MMLQQLSREKDQQNILKNILIVDDQIENLKVLDYLLVQKGYKIRKAINGQTALLAAESKAPDLILLDIKMPDIDGYEVCRRLKNNPKLTDIPIIFISALDETFNRVQAFKVGGCDYITKPFQVEEVLARVNVHLTLQQQKYILQQEIEKRREKEQQLLIEITKRQETEEILYQSRAVLSSVLNSSLDGIGAMQAVRDSTGEICDFRCLIVNPFLAQKIGVNKNYLIGKKFLKMFLRQKGLPLFDEFVELVNTGKPLVKDILYENNDQNNKETWYHFIAVKLGDGFAITLRDITERKEVELALQEANRKLEILANLDGLTKVYNRRYFDEKYKQEWLRLAREKQELSLIICDIDYFKRYNDYYGHLAGDDCIIKVAQSLNNSVRRPADFVARYGGEEFVIVLPNTPLAGALEIAEHIKENVNKLQILHENSSINKCITLSLGVSSIIPSVNILSDTLINSADHALYNAKQSGRDRIEFSQNHELN
jgi:two-component system, cell cycle response regulator